VYCDQCVCVVCLSVCLSACVSQKLHSKFHQIFCTCYLLLWLGPPLMAVRYVMYLLLGFVDDVMFSHNAGMGQNEMFHSVRQMVEPVGRRTMSFD